MNFTAIKNAIIFTVNKNNDVYYSGTIVLKDKKIHALGHAEDVEIPTENCNVIDAQNKLAILPGLIDTHSHSSFLKGFSENLQLLDWLKLYQLEHKVLTEEDAYYAAMISYLEAIKGGTTCVLDMYRFMHRCAEAAQNFGMRLHLAPYVADMPGKDFFETLATNEQLIKSHHNSQEGKIKVWIGLEHLFYCSEKAYHRAASLSKEYGVGIHTHTSEQKEEVQAVVKEFSKRPIHLFKERGILGPQTLIAHCVWLNEEEIQILADSGSKVAHCPVSNAKLAGGTAPIEKLQRAKIPIGIGTDGSISNNSLSMWECMKFGSLIQKNLRLDAKALSAPEILRMATIDGAKVLGIDSEVGSLEVGKKADLITVNLWQPHLMPIAPTNTHNPIIWNLVFAGRASDVKDVWIDGKQVVKDYKVTTINEDDLLQKVHSQTISLLKRREKYI